MKITTLMTYANSVSSMYHGHLISKWMWNKLSLLLQSGYLSDIVTHVFQCKIYASFIIL